MTALAACACIDDGGALASDTEENELDSNENANQLQLLLDANQLQLLFANARADKRD